MLYLCQFKSYRLWLAVDHESFFIFSVFFFTLNLFTSSKWGTWGILHYKQSFMNYVCENFNHVLCQFKSLGCWDLDFGMGCLWGHWLLWLLALNWAHGHWCLCFWGFLIATGFPWLSITIFVFFFLQNLFTYCKRGYRGFMLMNSLTELCLWFEPMSAGAFGGSLLLLVIHAYLLYFFHKFIYWM